VNCNESNAAVHAAPVPGVVAQAPQPVRSWPLLILALPAAVAVWSGWVGIGQMTGFGIVRPLPGIWDSLHVDTAVTLPLGVEAYAAFALRAWLTGSSLVSSRTRRFARWSAIGSLILGMAGQVAYHLLAQSSATRAPWGVTTLVSCLPVLVLAMGAALAHMLHADTSAGGEPGDPSSDLPPSAASSVASGASVTIRPDRRMPTPDQIVVPDRNGPDPAADQADQGCDTGPGQVGRRLRVAEAQSAATALAAAGRRVSRRNLRAAGVRGSNADLSELTRIVGPRSMNGMPAGAPAR